MFANFHTHTTRCNHATGTEREYIEEFIKKGVKVLGFSDHSPQYFLGDYSSWFRMDFDKTADYFDTLNSLKKEYEKDIKIYIGYETEYYPETFDKILKFYKDVKVDYLILGQHAIYNEREGVYTSCKTDNEKYMIDYSNQVIEGIKTGVFSYIAHPDVINFVGNDTLKEDCLNEIAKQAKALNIPLEVNFYGIFDGRYYPSETLYRVAKKNDNQMIFGVDAHSLSIIKSCDSLEKTAMEKINEYGLTLATKIKLFDGSYIKILE